MDWEYMRIKINQMNHDANACRAWVEQEDRLRLYEYLEDIIKQCKSLKKEL